MTKMTSKCHQNDAQVQTGVGLGLEVFGSQAELDTRFPQVRLLEGEEVSRHDHCWGSVGCILPGVPALTVRIGGAHRRRRAGREHGHRFG